MPSFLPSTLSWAGPLCFSPPVLIAKHEYSPTSPFTTEVMTRSPSSWIWILSSGCTDSPSFRQITLGSGFPLGGRQCRTTVWPTAVVVSIGSWRKSSRKTEKQKHLKIVNSKKKRKQVPCLNLISKIYINFLHGGWFNMLFCCMQMF